MGFTLIFADFDGPLGDNEPNSETANTTYDGYWATGGFDAGIDASDFFLAPLEPSIFTAVEIETWGRLKSRFR